MTKIYPLEWFDSLILETLNPDKANIRNLSDSDQSLILEYVLKESKNIQGQLKNDVFFLQKKSQIRLLVRKYHSTLIYLLDHIIENQKNEIFKTPALQMLAESITDNLSELLSFIENRFSNYLSLDERVPLSYLAVSKKELSLKLERFKRDKLSCNSDLALLESIILILSGAIQSSNGNKITYRRLLYQKELLKSLEDFCCSGEIKLPFCLDALLIASNFNSIDYISQLTERLLLKLDSETSLVKRMDLLLLYHKEFSQLQSNEKISFDPRLHNIKFVLDNWFKHEIHYLKRKIQLSQTIKTEEQDKNTPVVVEHENKIECILSTDQMGLILRATDESRILKARSMNQVFKTIVPYLSTPFKRNLSYQSVRSKSYNAEERDKEIAIQTLEKIIKKIKTY